MAGEALTAQRDKLVQEQLRGIREDLGDLKSSVAILAANLDAVRTAELQAIRTNVTDLRLANQSELAKQDAEIKLLRYQMGRTAAWWALVSGAVMTAIVGAIMALVMQK